MTWKFFNLRKKVVERPGFHLVLTSNIDLTKPPCVGNAPADHFSFIGNHPDRVRVTLDLGKMKIIEVTSIDGTVIWRVGDRRPEAGVEFG